MSCFYFASSPIVETANNRKKVLQTAYIQDWKTKPAHHPEHAISIVKHGSGSIMPCLLLDRDNREAGKS